jgi:hypothetical protein
MFTTIGLLINNQVVIIKPSAKYATGMLHAKKGPTEAKQRKISLRGGFSTLNS